MMEYIFGYLSRQKNPHALLRALDLAILGPKFGLRFFPNLDDGGVLPNGKGCPFPIVKGSEHPKRRELFPKRY